MAGRFETQGEVLDALVVGAGFSGLYALHHLRNEKGLRVAAVEAGEGVGGTWYWNRYPGARCDSDGYVYCYSFSEELLQEWQWSGKYPTQPEILSYLEHVAERFDLTKDIRLSTRVTRAVFDEEIDLWVVTTSDGSTLRARFLVSGIGHLSIAPYTPDWPGLEDFRGRWSHTAQWPAEGIDLEGKRVAVIGTGSSGVQVIPVIAEVAEHVTVFQRTPQFSIPARHETVDDAFYEEVKRNYDTIWDAARHSAGGFPWQHNGTSALDVPEDERLAHYERLWREGGVKFALGSYKDLSYDADANATVTEFMKDKIRDIVRDPATREKLVPTHAFLARRPIIDTDYFETYNRSNVSLVDMRTEPIERFTEKGVRTSEREHEVDVIIFATGFDGVTGPFFAIDLQGRGGTALRRQWADGARSYLGLMTTNFPNLFLITGPGSTLGNLPLTIETHVEWVGRCIAEMQERGAATVEPTQVAEDEWTQHVAEQAARSLISTTDSWFNGSNIPGKARAYVFYLGHFGRYRELLGQVADDGYPGLLLDGKGSETSHALDLDNSAPVVASTAKRSSRNA